MFPTPTVHSLVTREDTAGEADFDFSALIALTDGDSELARELVEIFIDECPKLLLEIRSAIGASRH